MLSYRQNLFEIMIDNNLVEYENNNIYEYASCQNKGATPNITKPELQHNQMYHSIHSCQHSNT